MPTGTNESAMKTNHASKITLERLTKLDDYEPPAHVDLDHSKAKPNRFAKYKKHTVTIRNSNYKQLMASRAAKRSKLSEPTERHTVTLPTRQVEILRKMDSSISRAISKLLDAASPATRAKRTRK